MARMIDGLQQLISQGENAQIETELEGKQVAYLVIGLKLLPPGKLANTLTLAKIRYENSAPRNIFLMKFLDNLRYFDGLGRGVPMMLKLMQERIVFEEIAGFVVFQSTPD